MPTIRLVGSITLILFGIAMLGLGLVYLSEPDIANEDELHVGIGVGMIVVGVIGAIRSKRKRV